ncbi:MAG: response regulator [Candidatus Cloacimonadaceae bacterium]|nr:response regulator [Candidatus Cloacimonadaceae bacterium]MDP3114178.1 response regulator [Candidatus Cloacimonadaceae bacterium]
MTLEPPKLLIVDDSISIVNSLCKILELQGYQVDSAFNGSDALRNIRENQYDLVICDIDMPGITGLDLLDRVRKDYDRELDVILMTGFLEHDYFIQAIRLGAADFIRKPVESKQMLRSIKSILERRNYKVNMEKFLILLEVVNISFQIDPRKFAQYGFSKVFNKYLLNNTALPKNLMNEILICADEMIYNAYLHGTLELDKEQRHFGFAHLQDVIAEKLALEHIAKRRIRFSFTVDQLKDEICIRVEDDGNGFDYVSTLKLLEQENQLNTDGHGRGLSMLYHLCDKLEFTDGGRVVQIKRSLKAKTIAGA